MVGIFTIPKIGAIGLVLPHVFVIIDLLNKKEMNGKWPSEFELGKQI